MSPKVSVIVPIYDVEKYLNRCVDSILNQSLPDIEIILVDDGSSDKSPQIVDEYASKHSRVIAIHQPNGGQSVARNAGLDIASAPYIMFCDSDDFFEPQMCEVMYEAITQNDADIADCGTRVIYEADTFCKKTDATFFYSNYEGVVDVARLHVKDCPHGVPTKIFRRSVIDEHQLRFPQGLKYEDNYFSRAFIMYSRKIVFVKEQLYNYRRRSGSTMDLTYKKVLRRSEDHLSNALLLWERFKKEKGIRRHKTYLYEVFFDCLASAIVNEGNKEKRTEILRTASAFARREMIIDPEFDDKLREKVDRLKNGYNPDCNNKEYFLGKIIRKRTSCNLIRYQFLGITVAKISSEKQGNENTQRFSIFGVPCGKRVEIGHDQNLVDQLPQIRPLDCDDSALLEALRELDVFDYIPHPSGRAEVLTAGASLSFFEKHQIRYHLTSEVTYQRSLVIGGGEWSEENRDSWMPLVSLLKKADKAVILPGSYLECPEFVEALDECTVVFCRDKQSFDYLCEQKCPARVLLEHDMGLRMDLHPYTNELLRSYQGEDYREQLSRVAWEFPNFVKQGLFQKPELNLCASVADGSNREKILFSALLLLCLVDQVQEVVTDQLQMAIAGVLLGKKTLLVNGHGERNAKLYADNLAKYPSINLLPNFPELPPTQQEDDEKIYKINSVLMKA